MNVAHNVSLEGGITFYGGDLDDIINVSGIYNSVFAGKGEDIIIGNGNFGAFYGEDGNDTIDVNSNRGEVYGGNGDDKLYYYGSSQVDAQAGNDTIYIQGPGDRVVLGGVGNDTFIVKSGVRDVYFDGGAGTNNVINGGQCTYINTIDSNGYGVTLKAKETKSFQINGVTYTVTNKRDTDNAIVSNYNSSTGQVTFKGLGLDVKGQTNVKHNVITAGELVNFWGGDLNDTIWAKGYYNSAYGGKGNDNLTVEGNNFAHGEDGDDILTGNGGGLYGGEGNNIFDIYRGGNDASSGSGNDVFNIYSSDINVKATGSGNKVYNVYGNNNTIEGGSGADSFNIVGNGNTLRGMADDDFFLIDGDNNYVDGGSGTNICVNNGKNNTIINLINDPNSGILNFTYKGEVLTFNVNGVVYTVTNENADGTAPATNQLLYNRNSITGEIILAGSNLTVDSPLNSKNNLLVKGDNNTIHGGDLNDTITVQSGTNNILHGGKGDDKLTVNTTNNSVFGDDGNDTLNISASSGNHNISGGEGNDVLNITTDSNLNVNGDGGDDTIKISGKNNIADTGFGNDEIIVTGTGNKVSATDGNNKFIIESNNNTVIGGSGKDEINITGNNNNVNAGDGNNNVYVNGNTNTVTSGMGDDNFSIGGESNTVSSSAGENNFIINGSKNKVNGGSGADEMIIRGSNNIMKGKEGNDAFIVKTGNNNDIDGNEGYNTMINYGNSTTHINVVDITNIATLLRLQVGANGDECSRILVDTSFSFGGFSYDVSTTDQAVNSITEVDDVIDRLNKKISEFGAVQNRLYAVLDSQSANIENFTAAKSTIMDADIAQESVDYVRSNILQELSTSLLVQSRRMMSDAIMGLLAQ